MSAAENKKPEMKSVLLELMTGVCSPDSQLKMTETTVGDTVTLSVYPDQRNYGRIVGAEAKNVWAFQVIAKLIGSRENMEVFLNVVSPKNQTPPPHVKFAPNPKWGKKQLLPLVQHVCELLFETGGVIEITEPDPIGIIVLIKVNAEDEKFLEVVEGGQRLRVTRDRSIESGREVDANITFAMVEQKLRTIFAAIGKNNGRNITLRLSPIHYPQPR